MTRKVFVQQGGYFARYLEILSNPTSDPITVDINVVSNVRGIKEMIGAEGGS